MLVSCLSYFSWFLPPELHMFPRRLSALAGLILIPVLADSLLPTTPAKDPPKFQAPSTAYECRWADTPIKIDGKGDEPAWKHAQVIDRFYLPWLKQPRDSKTKTEARLLWDRDYV